ncbi:zinc finger CCCH domain-containing protein 13 isoform X2 [Neolamprologus brichardi]|uniref:zinc finger CCCH domain-containing protein 13 isoform X2 n=1 Tax=Neolamprologus brichardi TaxID=32507 RepID=UPI0003EC4791|nr:zinc finger CCCH domain-containing protein 13 isoform X2 [Neolamprologus brichardi]
MGTKRPSWTLFDTLTKTSRSDHKLQPGGKIPLDPSHRPAMTGWFKRELERTAKKGDTFPRMKKGLTSPDRRLCTEMDEERGERRWNDTSPKRAETDVWGQEREKTFQVEKERYEGRHREKDEGKPTGRGYIEDEKLRQRGRYQELSDVRFQDGRREVDESRDRRMVRMGSPHRRKERENYADRKENENARRREKRRDIRSEGDDDERRPRRERGRDREREELILQYSRSEGDNTGKMANDRDREMQRYRDRNRDKERRKETDRQDKEGGRDLKEDRRDRREYEPERDRKKRGKEAGTRIVDATGRSSRSPKEWAPGPPARAHSSGEWSSDPDNENRHRTYRDRYEERESRRDSSFEKKRERETWRDQDRTADKSQRQIRNERQESDKGEKTGNMPEQRRMWLEPQRGKNSTDKFVDSKRHTERKELRGEGEMSMYSQTERGRDGRPVKEEPDCERRQGGRSEYREDAQREQEGVGADQESVGEIRRGKEHMSDSDAGVEESWQRDEQGDNVIDDREDENGSNNWPPSESEGGSEAGWKKERNEMPSTEDGFVTMSSGGEDSEEGLRDCQEFQEGGTQAPAGFQGFVGDQKREEGRTVGEAETADGEDQGEEKQPKYVFCVVGQTLPRSKPSNILPLQVDQIGGVERSDTNLETHHELVDDITQQPQKDLLQRSCRNDEHPMINNWDTGSEHKVQREERLSTEEATESKIHSRLPSAVHNLKYRKEMRSKVKQSYSEMGRKDSKTERLLQEWREKNKEPTDKKEIQTPISQSAIDQLQPILDQINTTGMSPEEVEAIRIRLSGTWSVSEEPKRHSQAPHLKWAKNVVREILGHSEEEPNTEAQEDQPAANQTETSNAKPQEEVAEETREVPAIKLSVEEDDLEPELEELFDARDDEDDRSKSLGELGLRKLLGTFERKKSNSRFYNAAQLYQQYSEAAQNSEILRQARSEFLFVSEDQTSSPLPSPPPARRALPPIPPQPQSFSHTGSLSIQSLPLPECPRGERRSSSPRLSISQSSSLWRDLPGVRNSAELDELTEDQRRLQEVRFEVITSEASYCRSLEIVVDHFVKSKQLGAQLTTQDKNWLFSRLVDVRAISHSFLSKLEEQVESDVMHFTVCDIIYRQCPLFRKAYVPYLTNQSYQDATYQRLMNENPRFKMIVEKIEKSAVCQRLPLRSFLVLPFQRITRLKLLVQNIVKRTTRGTAEATQAIKALKQLEKIIQQGNDSISQMKSIESLVSLSAKVDFECKTLPLISQSRRMVREGPVTQLMDFSLKETEKNAYLHLFNDYLLLSLPKEGGKFTVIDHCPVSELRVENCRVKLHSLQKNLFRLYMAQKSLLLRTDAPSDKLRWISALSRPHTEVDFSSAQDFEQMQCIRAFFAQQPDELSLEKADVILVHQESSDNWVEGTKLSDRQRGWVPKSHLETIVSSRVKSHNLSDALKLTAATA